MYIHAYIYENNSHSPKTPRNKFRKLITKTKRKNEKKNGNRVPRVIHESELKETV